MTDNESTHTLLFYFLHWIFSALAVLVTCKIMPGWKVKGFGAAMIAAVVIGLANMFIWPIFMFLTLPINILTLGLFTFVVNGAVIKLCSAMLADFEVDGWISAIIGALILSVINAILHYFFV